MIEQRPSSIDIRKLSQHERDVFARIQLNADVSHQKIGRDLGVRPSTVSAIVERLTDGGLIVRRPLVDLGLLGIATYFFYAQPETAAARRRLLDHLQISEGISFLHEVEGPCTIFAGFNVSPVHGMAKLFTSIRNSLGFEFGERSIGRVERQVIFGRKYLSPPFTARPIVLGTKGDAVELNATDVAILKTMSLAPRTSREAIARATRLPSSTIGFRLTRLEQKKVVVGHGYTLACIPKGIISARLLVRLRGVKDSVPTLEQFALLHPNVVTLAEISGPWDYELAIDVESARDVRVVADELEVALSPGRVTIQTLVVSSTLLPLRFPFSDIKSLERHL